jgi:signal transduction histidine kinase
MRTNHHALEHCVDATSTRKKISLAPTRSTVADSIVDATALVAGIAETTRILAGDKPVLVELMAPDLPVLVTTDPDVLMRIVMDLVRNALRSTECGKITLALKIIGSTPEIVVTDTGHGYRPNRPAGPDAEMDHAGIAGSRVDEATVPGLNASRDLARRIGGSISVRSVYGRGAMFTLTLPLRAADRRRDLYAVE